MGCCSCRSCGVVSAVIAAIFFAPLVMNRPKLVKIDDVKSWGFKGPYASSLSKNMKGVYFADGNQLPWTSSSKCNATEAKNTQVCRNGWKRSSLVIIDTSYMYYDRAKGTITQHPSAVGASALESQGGGMGAAIFLRMIRQMYVFDKNDPEFVGRSAEFFEGSMKLYFFMGLLPVSAITKRVGGVDYRVTAEDTGDGSVIKRYTWIGGPDYNNPRTAEGWPYDKPAPKSQQFKDYHYTLRRLMDADGNVDKQVLADFKKVHGDDVIIFSA